MEEGTNIQRVKEEFCKERGLKPFKIGISGKPCSGKSFYAAQLAKHYGVPHIHKEQVLHDIQVNMRQQRGVVTGQELVDWLQERGLVMSRQDGEVFGRHLLRGRVIRHVDNHLDFSEAQDLSHAFRMAEEFGINLQTTHPDEVAEMALKGLPDGNFWLLELTDENEAKIRRRADMIINKTTPVPESVG